MKLHLFNPENDLALACGSANFTPPKSVVEFRTALAALPIWIAQPGDNIIAPELDAQWLRQTGTEVGLNIEGTPSPWGWSENAAWQFRRLGIDGPYPNLDYLRQLSHRRTSISLYNHLSASNLPYSLPPAPREITSAEELPDTDLIMLKSPWSCSGRGVIDCQGLTSSIIRRRAEESIRRQGSVMVESKLNKARDFAMLFEGGKYKGLSLFITNGTSYTGNIVAPENELAAMLGASCLAETAKAIEQWLPTDYDGPMGVDMMLLEDGNICPCVEINVRKTMGFVAHALANRFGKGEFHIAARPKHIPNGAFHLVPKNSNFAAYLI